MLLIPGVWVPALRSSVPDDAKHRRENAAPRPGHEGYFSGNRPEAMRGRPVTGQLYR
jgi:transposase